MYWHINGQCWRGEIKATADFNLFATTDFNLFKELFRAVDLGIFELKLLSVALANTFRKLLSVALPNTFRLSKLDALQFFTLEFRILYGCFLSYQVEVTYFRVSLRRRFLQFLFQGGHHRFQLFNSDMSLFKVLRYLLDRVFAGFIFSAQCCDIFVTVLNFTGDLLLFHFVFYLQFVLHNRQVLILLIQNLDLLLLLFNMIFQLILCPFHL